MRNITEIRRHYQQGSLEEKDLFSDPMALFYKWWDEAVDAEVPEPNAMTLATVNHLSQPSARIVLLKSASEQGFEFFTNYNSRKARELEQNPAAALLFLWKELERQVRIEGTVERLPVERNQVYFQSRPRGSQIGAWASPQSKVIPDREMLEKEVEKISGKFENVDPLPCPDHWGGYLVRPMMIEFWQGRGDRLHDRFRYTRNKNEEANWSIDRLAP